MALAYSQVLWTQFLRCVGVWVWCTCVGPPGGMATEQPDAPQHEDTRLSIAPAGGAGRWTLVEARLRCDEGPRARKDAW